VARLSSNLKAMKLQRVYAVPVQYAPAKGAMMTPQAVPNEKINLEVVGDNLGLYEFDNKVAKHYFRKTCGIFTHNETLRMPGHGRINLGCIDDLDTTDFEVKVFDGKNLL
jgi:hypothetical protein